MFTQMEKENSLIENSVKQVGLTKDKSDLLNCW